MTNEMNNVIPIGIPGAPWPTMMETTVTDSSGKTVTSYELGVLEDPLILHSARSYAEAMGELYRGMPVRSMLPAFEEVVKRANPAQNNRIVYLVSNPGLGKSYLAVLIGKARDERGPMVTDAGGKNLEYLLCQTVFDTAENRPLTEAIDERLASGSISPLSLKALREGLGTYFSEQDDRMCVDWEGLSEDDTISQDTITQALESVRAIENLDTHNSGIAFRIEDGPLVVAHREERDLVIDEISKCKPGSEAPLQRVWQVLNGEIDSHTVNLGGSRTFTFEKGKPGVVICTGNLPKDGQSTHLISESFDRRVPTFRIPDFNELDWQDRIAGILTGLPLPMLHRMAPGTWQGPADDKKWVITEPEEFTKVLFEISTLGMDEDERRNVPGWKMSELGNWDNVLEVSRRLGSFYHKWAQLVDPESAIHKRSQFPHILLEVDNSDDPTAKITPSTMIGHVEDALIPSPNKKPIERSGGFAARNWSEPVVVQTTDVSVEENIGTRLVTAIMEEVYRTTSQTGKTHLYEQLMIDAREAGLVGQPPDIAALLNVDPMRARGPVEQARRAQSVHAALLRELYADAGLSSQDEDILALRVVQDALEQMEREDHSIELSSITTVLQVPNGDIDNVEEQVYRRVAADNIEPGESIDEARGRMPVTSLLDTLTLLSSFTLPIIGANNLSALWNRAHTGEGFSTEVEAIAQNRSSSGYAITSLMCRTGSDDDPQYEELHVLRNAASQHIIIIGNHDIPAHLRSRLENSGIIYCNRSEAADRDNLNTELDLINADTQQQLTDAFLLRNDTTRAHSLAELLTQPVSSTLARPNFITAIAPEDISHTQRVTDSRAANKNLLEGLF